MSLISCSELAHIRMQQPDLDLAERFLNDFGLLTAERTDDRLYLRGTDEGPHCYIVEKGESRMLGFAFHAKARADLETLAKATGAAIEPISEPGGGERVVVTEPNGYAVEIVFGVERTPPITLHRQLVNTAAAPLARAGELYRLTKGEPTPVRRLAHVVMGTPLVTETEQWFRDTLGLLPSDEVYAEIGGKHVGTFLRIDKGEEFVDHHTIFAVRSDKTGLQHVSFESQDMDAVLADNDLLKKRGYEHLWGIGRHLLGSQMFDYWLDPFGYVHEHWADTDRLNASAPSNTWVAAEGLSTQYGEPASEKFRSLVKL